MAKTYVSREMSLTLKQRLCLCGVIWLGSSLCLFFGIAWPKPLHGQVPPWITGLEALFAGVAGLLMAGVTFLFHFRKRVLASHTLVVDEDELTTLVVVNIGFGCRPQKTTVRRGRVRTFIDYRGWSGKPRGFRVSESGKWACFFSGCVFVPNTLPDYEEIRRRVEDWPRFR